MKDEVKLDILVIAAHPDDVEITCGGLLIKMHKIGRKTGVLDLTKGEMGTYGNEQERHREAEKAGEIMGLSFRHNLSLPDSAIEYNQENKLKIAQIIRDTQPEMVILPHWKQRHPDHLACMHLSYDACFLSGLKKIALDGKVHRPRKIIYASYFRNDDYSFLVDISDEFEQKCQAVAAYRSQFDREEADKKIFHPGVNIYEFMQQQARYLGQLVGVKYAEAYTIKEKILMNDPQKMQVASI